jgi:hypothetical protein
VAKVERKMNDENGRVNGGYYEDREAERLLGHYMLALAILGDESNAQPDLNRMRRLPRREARLAAHLETADLTG